MKILLLIMMLFLINQNLYAHGGGEASIEIGKDKGVIELLKDGSFTLSNESISRLKIKATTIQSLPARISRNAVSFSLLENKLFKMNGSTFKKIDFKFLSKSKEEVVIQSSELKNGDQIVVSGIGYLQIISSQLGEGKEEKHSDEIEGGEDSHEDHKEHDDHQDHKDNHSEKKEGAHHD